MATPISEAQCLDLLADAAWELARALPFHGHVLAALDRVVDRRLPTAAVGPGPGGRPVLYLNPEFFVRSLSHAEHRVALLEHEVLHLVFGHLRIDAATMPDAKRRNLAADLVVNQYVTHALPRGAVTLTTIPGMPRDETCEAYYRLLVERTDRSLRLVPKEVNTGSHERWRAVKGDSVDLPGNFLAAVEAITAEALARAERDGSLQALSEPLRAALLRGRPARAADPTWKRALRLFCDRAVGATVRPSLRRESRRYGSDRARWDGPIVPGLRRGKKPALAVVVDTSGSISQLTLTVFFEQVARIAAAGAVVHVIECDDRIRRVYPWKGIVPPTVHGRGGTRFDPVFQWMREDGRALHLTGCVYLTDGLAPRPEVRPPCPVLWVITPGGSTASTAFGPSVPMPP